MQQAEEVAAEAAQAPKKRGPQVKGWCFTWNNPTHKILFPDGLPVGVRFLVYQEERGAEGTAHLQGYIYFSGATRMTQIKNIEFKTPEGASVFPFRGAHLEAAKGSPEQNVAYCTKAETRVAGPWTLGEVPKGAGERTDLHRAAEELMRSGDIRAIDPAVFIKYASGCLKLAALAPPPRRDNLKVITIIGATGIGKSYSVHDLYPDVFVVNMGNSGLWWDGYTGQPAIMFEEFKGQVQLQKMLQILDPYPLRLEIKGGLVPARFTVVFITSNTMPKDWYENKDGRRDAELKALDRRLDTESETNKNPIRFINVDSRDELHRRLDRAMAIADLSPKPAKRLSPLPGVYIVPQQKAARKEPAKPDKPIWDVRTGEMATDDTPCIAAAAAPPSPPQRPKTPEIDPDQDVFVVEEGAPRLKRHKAKIIVDDAPADADMVTDEATGVVYVRDDILAQFNQAPQP